MRFLNCALLTSASAAATTNGTAIDTNQIFKVSAQVVVGAGTSLGTLQLQVSDDPVLQTIQFATQANANWSNLGSSVAISAAGATLIAQQDICYRALRAVYTSTFANISTITAVADVAGSLNNTYFLASSKTADYYFWFDDGAGVDPAISGRTGIHVTYMDGDTATTIGGLIRTAAAAKGWTVTGATSQAILTNSVGGPTTIASDGAVPTHFTIANTQATSSITVNLVGFGI